MQNVPNAQPGKSGMKGLITGFIVLIEERAVRLPRALAALTLLAGLVGLPAPHAQTAGSKIAADLQQAIDAPTTPKLNWAKDVSGVRHVKALVISDSSDPDLAALRAQVIAAGGSVYFRYT